MDSISLLKSRSSIDEEIRFANARTADSSPFNQEEKEKQSSRSMRRSKFSKSIVQGSKLTFPQIDSEFDGSHKVSRFSCAGELNSVAEMARSTIYPIKRVPKKSEIQIFFLVPVETITDLTPLKPSLTQTTKKGFVIDFVIISMLNTESKVHDLIDAALIKINKDLQGRFDYYFAKDSARFSLRPSKKSGFPDFDFPGNPIILKYSH